MENVNAERVFGKERNDVTNNWFPDVYPHEKEKQGQRGQDDPHGGIGKIFDINGIGHIFGQELFFDNLLLHGEKSGNGGVYGQRHCAGDMSGFCRLYVQTEICAGHIQKR